MRIIPLLSIFVVAVGAYNPASGQLATLRGSISDGSDDQPLQGVNVVLESEDGRLLGTASLAGGYYILARIPPDAYQLRVSLIGYTTIIDTLAFAMGNQSIRNFRLFPDMEQLGDVVVEGDRSAATTTRAAGLITVRPAELARVSLPGLAPDLASSLLVSPGIVTIGDRGGQLFVRGGTPVENLFLLDGMRLYRPLHILGFFSAFPTEIISYADIYAGGFGARYGGQISSVVDVNTRNGNKRRIRASGAVSPFLGGFHVEVPVIREKVSVVASVRESLIQDVGPDLVGEELPYRFGDRFFKFHAFLNQTSNFALTMVRTNDEGNLAGDVGIDRNIRWRNRAFGGRYFYLADTLPVLTELRFYVSRLGMDKGPRDAPAQSSTVDAYSGAVNFGYLFGVWELHFGIFGRNTKFEYILGPTLFDRSKEFVAEGGVFVDGTLRLSRGLTIHPGYRLHSFPSRGQAYGEPRFRLAWAIPSQKDISITAAWGLYHQQIIGLTDDRVPTDVFTAWSASPQNETIPSAMHTLVGFSASPRRWLDARIELYRKDISNLGFPQLGEELSGLTRFLDVDGVAQGGEASVSVSRRRWFAQANYTLASVEYAANGEEFRPPHDRRHQVSVTAIATLFENVRLRTQWQFGSGVPFTQLIGFFEEVEFGEPGRGFHDDPGATRAVFDSSFGGRLPSYHRLDTSVEYVRSTPFAAFTLQAGAVNAYNRDNWFDFDYVSLTRVNQLPVVPTVGLRIETR